LVALNESEASELLGCEFDISRPESFVDRCLSFVNQDSPGIRLIVSLGARGVLLLQRWLEPVPCPRGFCSFNGRRRRRIAWRSNCRDCGGNSVFEQRSAGAESPGRICGVGARSWDDAREPHGYV